LDGWAFRKRITEWDTQFYEVSPRSLELGHYFKRGVDRWISDRNKRHEGCPALIFRHIER
jgi:hypothetical protein